MPANIQLLGHASFKITGEKVVYIDPWKISETEKADIILISHSHYDHCSLEDIEKVADENTNVLLPPDCQSKLGGHFNGKVHLIEPNKKYNVQGILIETIPSYNITKEFHPKENDWVGFVITINNKRIYYTGDTDLTEESKQVKCDIALVPVGGNFTLNSKEAAELVNILNPELTIPYHFGDIIGTKEDAEEFKNLAKIPVEIYHKLYK